MNTREFLFQRKNRCVGQILDKLEKSAYWGELDSDQKEFVRKLIKTKISSYHADVLDLMSVLDSGMAINAAAVKEKDRRRS